MTHYFFLRQISKILLSFFFGIVLYVQVQAQCRDINTDLVLSDKQVLNPLNDNLTVKDTSLSKVKPAKKKISLKDTLDHNLDFSDYLINMHGFVPWPVIISEPSLGNFGLALAIVFISPKKTAAKEEQFHFPDITGVAGMWTLNNTWGVGATRQGTFPKIGMRYTVSAAYADININFYRNFTA